MRKFLLVSICLLVGTGAAAAVWWLKKSPASQVSASSHQSPVHHTVKKSPSSPPPTTTAITSVTVNFDRYGFEPNQFSVPIGTEIIVQNQSSDAMLFQPLPGQPNQLASLNLGTIEPGMSKSFSVSQTGSWQFQANNSPALRGNITVTQKGESSIALTENELPQYNPATRSLLLNYTDFGFLPNMVKVPIGTKVTVQNSTDEGGMDFEEMAGDQSPDPALNLGIIEKGQSASFTINQAGVYHYVNTWEATDQGQITID